MAELRRQGVTCKDVAARLECSERTVRRYAGRVEPRLALPQAESDRQRKSPQQMREHLAQTFSDWLYNAIDSPRPRYSVTFLAESIRGIRERLEEVDPLTLELLLKDVDLRGRFLREVTGPLYADFRLHVNFASAVGCRTPEDSAVAWLPPRLRKAIPAPDDEEYLEPGDQV